MPKKRACDSCFRRKIHCDAARPQCDWCKIHNLACTFNRPMKVKKRTRLRGDHHGSDPAKTEESEISVKVPQTKLEHQETPTAAVSGAHPDTAYSPLGLGASFGKLHFAGYHLGEIASHNGIPFFSTNGQRWIYDRTGEKVSFQGLQGTPPLWQNQQHVYHALKPPDTTFELPDRTVVEDYFRLFRSTWFRSVFPIVDVVLFKETIDLAYETPPFPSLKHLSAKACVFAFLSVLCLMEGTMETVPVLDGDVCALQAQYLIPQVLIEANIMGLQISFMQSMYHLFSGKLQTATMFHSLACRIMFMLAAHTMPSPGPSPVQSDVAAYRAWRFKSHIRNYFWLCYVIDKDIALRTGHPPAIDDEHCDLTFPDSYLENLYNPDPTSEPRLPGDLRLTILKSKTFRLLYSAQALRKSDAELLKDVRELDEELERWRLSINPRYRPTVSYCSESRTVLNSDELLPDRMAIIVGHFEYYCLMATIHQATSRCHAWVEDGVGEMEGVSSSLVLSLEASRSTLVYLRSAVHALVTNSFWMLVFYPMTAMLTIFCNILLRPLDPRASEDLELLTSAPELIKSMRMRRLSLNEVMHLKMIDNFIAELIRLGHCAINRARRDRGSAGLGVCGS